MTDKKQRIIRLENKTGDQGKRIIWVDQDEENPDVYHQFEGGKEIRTLTKAELDALTASLAEDDIIFVVSLWQDGKNDTVKIKETHKKS